MTMPTGMKTLWLCGLATSLALPAAAQDAALPSERAQRDAANPLRVIMDAARIKRGKPEAEAPAPAPAPRPPAPRPVVAATRPAAAASAVPAGAPAPVVPAVAAVAEPPPAPPPATTVATTAAEAPQPVAAPAAALALPAPVPVAMPEPVAAPAVAAAERPLKLVATAEPEWPSSLARRVAELRSVRAVLTVQPDGSVSAVQMRSPNLRSLETYLQQALLQWRYEPPGTVRTHEVELVFNGS